MHIQHVEMLTGELQSYANKLTGVFGNGDENGETDVTSRLTEQHSANDVDSPLICDDAVTPRTESAKPDIKPPPDVLNENRKTICQRL